MNVLTSIVLALIPIVAILSYEYWEYEVTAGIIVSESSRFVKVLLLFLIGVIPLRLVHLIYVRSSILNKVTGSISLLAYLAYKLGLF